jgi:hypothetical protein
MSQILGATMDNSPMHEEEEKQWIMPKQNTIIIKLYVSNG